MKYLLLIGLVGLLMFVFVGTASAKSEMNYSFKKTTRTVTHKEVRKSVSHDKVHQKSYGKNFDKVRYAGYDKGKKYHKTYRNTDYRRVSVKHNDFNKVRYGTGDKFRYNYRDKNFHRYSYYGKFKPVRYTDYDFSRVIVVNRNFDFKNCGCDNWNHKDWKGYYWDWNKCGCNSWDRWSDWNNWNSWDWNRYGCNYGWDYNKNWTGYKNYNWYPNYSWSNWNPCHERAPCGYGFAYSWS
jgi:hypothetical protein